MEITTLKIALIVIIVLMLRIYLQYKKYGWICIVCKRRFKTFKEYSAHFVFAHTLVGKI